MGKDEHGAFDAGCLGGGWVCEGQSTLLASNRNIVGYSIAFQIVLNGWAKKHIVLQQCITNFFPVKLEWNQVVLMHNHNLTRWSLIVTEGH